jgi:hypothetical protein
MADDTLGTLRDFEAAMTKLKNTEGYDTAAESLSIYYNSIFKE